MKFLKSVLCFSLLSVSSLSQNAHADVERFYCRDQAENQLRKAFGVGKSDYTLGDHAVLADGYLAFEVYVFYSRSNSGTNGIYKVDMLIDGCELMSPVKYLN